MNIYSRARKYIDIKRVKELRIEKKEKDILLRQQEKLLAELKLIEIEEKRHCNWRRELQEEGMDTSGFAQLTLPAMGNVDLGTATPNFTLSGPAFPSGYNQVTKNMLGNRSKFDTIVVRVTSSSSDWEVVHGSNFVVYGSGGVGSYTVVIPKAIGSVFYTAKDDGSITFSTTYQRRRDVTAIVSLDDPAASDFIRDGQTDNLSPEEKKKKLEEQLAAGEEYLNKMFGEGMPKGATELAEYEPQTSFMDVAQGYAPGGPNPYGTPGADDPFDNDYYKGPPPDLDDDSDFPDLFPELDLAKGKKKKGTQVAHYEPQGEVIKEKKTFNDLTKKIPGYYDGKPSPLGFPVVEPPKMKDGMHPDLVDGKKTAKRFNRLDPVSARAMPKTGNPHIDKKVKAAAKKPK